MKKYFGFILLIVILSTSCDKFPFGTKEPTACIDGPLVVEEYQTATYSFCGKDADNFEWSLNGSGILGTGKSFVPTFTTRGKYVIVLKAKNSKYEKTTSIDVEYGKTSKTTCLITNLCDVNANISDLTEISYYWAFMYDTKNDWSTDISNGNHKLAKDSLQCQYSNSTKSAYVSFTKPYAIGSKKYISVEYRNSNQPNNTRSNWGGLFKGTSGIVEINYNIFNDNICSTVIDNYSKQILRGKWLLVDFQDNSGTPLGCRGDDYIKFYGDGTWKYFYGSDDCFGSAQESSGTLTDIPTCEPQPGYGKVIKTSNGPFETQTWYITFPNKMEIFTQGAVYANYTFTYMPL